MNVRSRSAEETAILLAILLKRSEKTRARISVKTVQELSNHKKILPFFFSQLQRHLEHYGYLIGHLNAGGFGVIKIRALEGARPVTLFDNTILEYRGNYRDLIYELESSEE